MLSRRLTPSARRAIRRAKRRGIKIPPLTITYAPGYMRFYTLYVWRGYYGRVYDSFSQAIKAELSQSVAYW